MDSYEDIINLPAPTSERHPRMPRLDRAAQFAPFSALSGYEDAISEVARLTSREIVPDESEKERLDRWQRALSVMVDAGPKIKLTYFIPDKAKRGGRYSTLETRLIGFSEQNRTITIDGGEKIHLENIKSLYSELFSDMLEGDW